VKGAVPLCMRSGKASASTKVVPVAAEASKSPRGKSIASGKEVPKTKQAWTKEAAVPAGKEAPVVSKQASVGAPENSTQAANPATEEAKPEQPRVFLSIPSDLCGLFLSSWMVPTVKRKRRGLGAFLVAALMQIGFLGYMGISMYYSDLSPCDTPAVMQLIAVFTFTASMLNELNSIRLLQMALFTTRLKVPGKLIPDALGRLTQGPDTIIAIRPTTSSQRMILALAPFLEMMIEMSTLGVGCVYLLGSGSIEDLILNAVAVNFVTQLDEIMLHAFVNKASRERLAKYLIEARFGVEDGDTMLKNASAASMRQQKMVERMPLILMLVAAGAVAGAQVWGRYFRPESTCTWVLPDL
jgi:hypothetical protein